MHATYCGKTLCLTTRHGKQRALARPFASGLGLQIEVCPSDTDQLGTFSGEIPRLDDAHETCRRKALLGLAETGLNLGLASEASFGPHPAVPMLTAGHELLLFVDLERQLEVVEQRVELQTNYSQTWVNRDQDPTPWLRQVRFPSHGVIARPMEGEPIKGIVNAQSLQVALQHCRKVNRGEPVQLETDMRAHMNPSRMASIRRLGFAMVRRLRTSCPACGAPGWGLVETVPGLPCRWCGEATSLSATEIWGCSLCHERRAQPRRDGLQAADPGHCSWCNP